MRSEKDKHSSVVEMSMWMQMDEKISHASRTWVQESETRGLRGRVVVRTLGGEGAASSLPPGARLVTGVVGHWA